MATLRDRVRAFMNPNLTPALPLKGEGEGVAPVVTENDMDRFKVERDRTSMVKDARAMYKDDPRVERMHRDYARDLLRNGFFVKTQDKRVQDVIGSLQTRLDLNQRLEEWLRLSMRDGESFLELEAQAVTANQFQLASVTRKPTLKMHRASNNADRFDNPAKAFWMGDDTFYTQEAPADAIWFPQWKIIHARWNHDEENRYGTPMMASARKHYKFVQEGELNIAVRRKAGRSMNRHHVVEGGQADVDAYIEKNKAAFGKLGAVVDFVSNKAGGLTVNQGDGNIDKIGDVLHNIETMASASDKPMELMFGGKDLNRDILGDKKEAYEEILNQGREWATIEILKPLIDMELLLNGILPASVSYTLVWRKAKTLNPQEIGFLADAAMKLKVLGVKDEVIQLILAAYLRDVDTDILNSDGFSAEQFANSIKGISV